MPIGNRQRNVRLRGASRHTNTRVQETRADDVERFELFGSSDSPITRAHITKSCVLTERDKESVGVNVFRRGDVNDRSLCCAAHTQSQRSGRNTTEIKPMKHERFRTARFANAGFIVQHLANGILTQRRSRMFRRRHQRSVVHQPTGKRVAHRRTQHAEWFARRMRIAMTARAERRDLERVLPSTRIEPGRIPTLFVDARIERLERQTRNIARHWHRRPRRHGRTRPRTIRDQPFIANQRFEHH